MDLYGNGIGASVIIINHDDKDKVDSTKWKGALIESESQKPGTVTFGRMPLEVEAVKVDKEDPSLVHVTLSGQVIQHGTTATISGDGGLIFSLAVGSKLEISNEEEASILEGGE